MNLKISIDNTAAPIVINMYIVISLVYYTNIVPFKLQYSQILLNESLVNHEYS